MSWIHYLLSDHYRTQMLTSHQQCWPYCADRNFGRLLTTSNTQLAECQVEPSDSCRPMMQIMPWLHALWPCPLDLCLLMYKPLWWSQWSICWYDFSWCSLWLDKLNISLSIPMYEDTPPLPEFFLYPLDMAWVVWLDITFSLVHLGQDGAIPGTVIHLRACDGSWFLAKTPVSGKKDTIFWRWVLWLHAVAAHHWTGQSLNLPWRTSVAMNTPMPSNLAVMMGLLIQCWLDLEAHFRQGRHCKLSSVEMHSQKLELLTWC